MKRFINSLIIFAVFTAILRGCYAIVVSMNTEPEVIVDPIIIEPTPDVGEDIYIACLIFAERHKGFAKKSASIYNPQHVMSYNDDTFGISVYYPSDVKIYCNLKPLDDGWGLVEIVQSVGRTANPGW